MKTHEEQTIKEFFMKKSYFLSVITLVLALSFSVEIHANQNASASLSTHPIPVSELGTIDLGAGWDSQLGITKSSCVRIKDGVAIPGRSSTLEQKAILEAYSSARELIEKYSYSVAGSYQSLGQGGSSGIKSASNGQFSDYRNYSFLTNTVTYIPHRGLRPSDFELTQQAKDMLNSAKGVAAFAIVCGDKFVTGVKEGGVFEARIEISSTTDKLQADVSKFIEVAASDGSFSAEDEQKLRKLSSEGRLRFEVSSSPSIASVPNLDFNSLVSAWKQYSDVVKNSQQKKIVSFEYYDYTPLIFEFLAGQEISLPPIHSWVLSVINQFNYLQRLSRFKGDLIYIRDHPDQFIYHDRNKLEVAIVNVGKTIDALTFWGMNCMRTNGETCKAPAPEKFVPPSPKRNADWTLKIDPLNRGYQRIGRTTDLPGAVEITGQFRIALDPRYADATWDWSELKLINLVTGGHQLVKPARSFVEVPPKHDVLYRLWDDYWPDNAVDLRNPAKARVGELIDLKPWL